MELCRSQDRLRQRIELASDQKKLRVMIIDVQKATSYGLYGSPKQRFVSVDCEYCQYLALGWLENEELRHFVFNEYIAHCQCERLKIVGIDPLLPLFKEV